MNYLLFALLLIPVNAFAGEDVVYTRAYNICKMNKVPESGMAKCLDIGLRTMYLMALSVAESRYPEIIDIRKQEQPAYSGKTCYTTTIGGDLITNCN